MKIGRIASFVSMILSVIYLIFALNVTVYLLKTTKPVIDIALIITFFLAGLITLFTFTLCAFDKYIDK